MTTTETQVSWQDYLAIIIRRRWFFVVPCAVIVTVAMLVGWSLPKIYRAETVLMVQDPKIMNPLIQGMAVASPVDVRMRVVQEELLGWTSLSRLVHELGLDKDVKSPAMFEGIVKTLQKDIGVTARQGGLIRLTYNNPDPQMAQRVLNTVTNIYVERNVESQNAEAETAAKFIENEMTGYRQKLENAERALREFKELYTVEMPVAAQLNKQIISLQVTLAQLLVENTEEHPTVVQIRRQIQELKQKRNEEVRRVVASSVAKSENPEIYQDLLKSLEAPNPAAVATNPKLQLANEAYRNWVEQLDNPALATAAPVAAAPTAASEDGGTAPEASGQSQAIDDAGAMSITLAPRQEQELSRLKRDYDVIRNTYHQMQQRLERAKVTQRLGESDEGTKFKVIEPARLPLRPVSPQLWIIFWGALSAGLFLGACAAFAAEYLDQSFQSAEDLQAALSLPVLASISRIVTQGDIDERHRRMKTWVAWRAWGLRLQWVNTTVVRPIWSRVDRALVRWGL